VRLSIFIIGAIVALAAAMPVAAQQTGSSFFTGVNPRTVTNVPIDTSKALKSMNVSNAFRTPAQAKPFSLTSIFPKVHMPTWPPKVASTPVLSQSNNPFQPNPILGRNPFSQTPAK